MAQPMLNKSDVSPEKKEAVVIKKYANRRLYNTETSTYVTLDDLAQMVRNDKDFVVYDAKSGDDLTHAVLTQIIVDQEGREGGQTLLPIPFLRQLIRFYDDNIGSMVPSYLQFSLENLVKEQEKFRSMFASAFSNPAVAFEAYQDQARKNMAMFEQAMSMWTSSFSGGKFQPQDADTGQAGDQEPPKDEIGELKEQLSAMQRRLERLAKDHE
ncbi:polyhydroxyalkanoate synthesis repressor PhaR [Hyphomicrobium nitrativorans NL23]|uniref:Polyhydroxyalkanoate synthesis repressor PhaR n=1 Tax=Hyphomicrobium nitrativorans NL23 TaxID=1029756 RepID=V5SA40_9HYPH|nr:polyhydroxyalkanoate synthesis repressor PhaR [Hyphomicrobium nitrativorans]AHB47606.1 polyhydroxyalkanoate synthesis repressor PhaR [Hyphomicrobium nitrativorans NL23]